MNTKNESVKKAGAPPVGETGTTAPLGKPPERPPFWSRRGVQIGFSSGAAFIIGLCVGLGGSAHWFHRMVHKGLRDPDHVASRMVAHMRHDLDLTDEQVENIKPLFIKSHATILTTIGATFHQLNSEIEKHLTEDQVSKHREIVERRQKRFFGALKAPGSQGDRP